MAISSTTVWEARTTGLSTNGGGFDPVTGAGATDYSLQDSPQLALVDIAIADNTTTTITSATGGFTSAMVGNIIYLTGGTGGTLATQRREITAVTDSNTATVDQAPAPSSAVTGVTGNLGGALSAPWDVYSSTAGSNSFVLGNILYIKSGIYTRTTTWFGKSLPSTTTITNRVYIVGYDTNRNLYNTDANRPEITTSTNSIVLFTGALMLSQYFFVRNLVFSNTAITKGSGVTNTTNASGCYWINCKFTGFSIGLAGGSSSNTQVNAFLINCEITNCSTGVSAGTNSGAWSFWGCYIHDNASTGITSGSSSASIGAINSIIVNNGGAGISFSATSAMPTLSLQESIVANNTTSQILYSVLSDPPTSNVNPSFIRSCVIWGGQYGIRHVSSGAYVLIDLTISRYFYKNAIGGASIANLSNTDSVDTDIILTEDPFIDSANRDYRLNKKSGGGLLCRGIYYALPGLESFPSYVDLGSYKFQPATLLS